ncbi:MAG TPA: hypothetical protein VFV96_06750 [Verrucomicrobiae bacterium]|nr:hypothetical protein [Verrucomicrobiae bacterium]
MDSPKAPAFRFTTTPGSTRLAARADEVLSRTARNALRQGESPPHASRQHVQRVPDHGPTVPAEAEERPHAPDQGRHGNTFPSKDLAGSAAQFNGSVSRPTAHNMRRLLPADCGINCWKFGNNPTMTDTEYQRIMQDVECGRKRINYQTAGAKNLFLRVSPQLFKERTGCSVHLSCYVTRAVVFILDPLLVVASAIVGFWWLGLAGVLLAIPAVFLWGWTKTFFSTRLPTGWTVLFVCGGISLLGYAYFKGPAPLAYFVCLGVLIFQNYLLYAIPLAEVMKCVPQSKMAFEIFYEASRNTLMPVLTVLQLDEYVDDETRRQAHEN